MSCLLDQVAAISNTSELVQWLCPHLSTSGQRFSPLPGPCPTDISEEDWSEDWGRWDDVDPGGGGDGEPHRKPSPSTQAETSWVSECYIAVSPTCDLMAVAYKNRLVILSSRWEYTAGEEGKMMLVNTWRGTVGFSASDEISALLCLPLISINKSSTGGPDWTCVIVGFTSGYVAMYTETGLLLLSQLFEEGEVVSLKCRTAHTRPTLAQDLTEELVVLYPQAITTIDGFSLLQTLRGCRNQVAKAAASGGENVSVPPLGYKKWGLVDQGLVTDFAAPGLSPPCLYDHLAQTTLSKGVTYSVPSGIPSISLLITTGRVPYIGFLTAQEGSAPPFVADVARIYASKLKDALVSAASGWLFGKAKTKEVDQAKVKPKIEHATPLPYRWSIPDKKRIGMTVSLASGRRLAAVTDDFGRVTLVDVQRGVTLRMWKGYRDADCGWVEVTGEWGEVRRTTCFLLIYAPRRGLLEVWTPQQGPRIAAFNVPKQSRLIYTSHTLLGASSVRGLPCRVFPVIFITPDGRMSEVAVPFHLALGGKTSRRARDLHLVKSLKAHLRSGKEGDVLAVLEEVKTLGVRRQAVILLITSSHLTVTLLQGLLNIFMPLYVVQEEGEEGQNMDHEGRLFGQQLVRLNQLLHLYMELTQLHTHREASPDPDHDSLVLELAKLLVLTPDETREVLSKCGQIGCFKHANTKRVTFSEESTSLTVGSFLRCWNTLESPLVKDVSVPILPIHLKEDLQEEKRLRLGEFLYGWAWHRESVVKFRKVVKACGGDLEALLHLALEHWLLCHDATTVTALHFGTILHTLAILAEHVIVCDISEQSPWWSKVRDKLTASVQPHQAYLAALLSRGVHASLETRSQLATEKEIRQATRTKSGEEANVENSQEFEEKSSSDMKDMETTECMEQDNGSIMLKKFGFPSLNDWEGLSMEMVEWNLVLWQLQSVMPISQLFSLKPKVPLLDVSVKVLLDKGKGYVAEMLANWFISSELPLSTILRLLGEQDKIRKRKALEAMEIDDGDTSVEEMNIDLPQPVAEEVEELPDLKYAEVNELLMKVGEQFPNSVAGDAVLTNMTWELAAGWHKSQDDVDLLTKAATHLAVIANSHIRHGVGVMVWETWIGRWVQIATSLVEKAGRAPRDRTCKRDLGLSEHNLAPALLAAATLLNQLMEANVVCEVEKPMVLTGDRLWNGQEGSPALVEVTVMQKSTCYDLLHLHHQLLTVLHLMVLHGIKNTRPLSCFDGKSRSMLFKTLSTSWTGEGLADPVVAKSRQALLFKIISATVVSLPDTTQPTQALGGSVRVASELGHSWGTSLDALRRHHVCELYNYGFDTLAEEVIPTINDHTSLGSQLVLLAGRRLHHQLLTSPRTAHHLALTSPTVTEWVKSCDTSVLRCPSVTLEKTLELLTRALNLLPESVSEHKLATELYHTLIAFVQDQQENSSPPHPS
ncbi:hypothetical protein Pmani_022352 [Petrolisthes manimaculis]|uniref:Rab3 GTPase-activating protein non-catalytic subunit n=1 Tax=Petrolisthes manimaculis TaxID=1843537 RepID=A0AAE1PD44_9EUCA|nr:hypothetical protein Pmani_022352 [Petrolisthes manimaculis]